jgi:hypothetical protein
MTDKTRAYIAKLKMSGIKICITVDSITQIAKLEYIELADIHSTFEMDISNIEEGNVAINTAFYINCPKMLKLI